MKKILLVDDDNIFIMLHRRMLELSGIQAEIRTASNGLQALELLQRDQAEKFTLPDLILLDLLMPEMDGFEFITRLKNLQLPDADSIKIIVLSSSADKRDITRVNEAGIVNYLVKPLTFDTLMETINRNTAIPA